MKAVIYARVSSTTDRQNTERQLNDLYNYAKAMNYELMETFSEKISGAVKNEQRHTLQNCIEYCIDNNIDTVLVSELSRVGRNVVEVQNTINYLIEKKINLYCDKEKFELLDKDKKPTKFAPIYIAVLATCAEIERESIQFRLNSGRAKYIAEGGKLGRKKDSKKDNDKFLNENKDVIKLLEKGTTIRNISTITGKSHTTVQKVKNLIK